MRASMSGVPRLAGAVIRLRGSSAGVPKLSPWAFPADNAPSSSNLLRVPPTPLLILFSVIRLLGGEGDIGLESSRSAHKIE